MPTHDEEERFWQDWVTLSKAQRMRFRRAVKKMVSDMRSGQGFRKGLRIRGVQGHSGVYEMTWAGDGRATFSYGASKVADEPHIIWRRIGSHDILQSP